MQNEHGDDPKRKEYWRRLPIIDGPRPTSRRMRLIGWTAVPIFAVAAFVLAGGLPFVSSRFEHMEAALCIPPRDIPWRVDAAGAWCRMYYRQGIGPAYTRVAALEFGKVRIPRALELYRRGAELVDPTAHIQIGMILVQGSFGQVPVDRAGGIAAFENAFKLGHLGASQQLRDTYSGQLGSGPREPKRAAMWAHAYALLKGDDMADARDYSRRLGLGEAEIDAAREEMRRWLVANKMIAR